MRSSRCLLREDKAAANYAGIRNAMVDPVENMQPAMAAQRGVFHETAIVTWPTSSESISR